MTLAPRVTALALAALLGAAVPAGAAEDLPTYTCPQRLPVPAAAPPSVAAAGCIASNGAPEAGVLDRPVRVVLPDSLDPASADSTSLICRSSSATAEDAGSSVVLHDCAPEVPPR
ncbi:hypothetical protein ACWCV9_19370 [Streptomyces sp. NPDC001606]